jgi:hypothetical protein
VPIIQAVIEQGHLPVFAGNDWQRKYISETFRNITSIHLDGYNVRYAKTKAGFLFSFAVQLPRLSKGIGKEHKWLMKTVGEQSIDGIISDNRYGLHHPHVPSVFMTHQLEVQSGISHRLDGWIRGLHYKYINRFGECWVVDVNGTPSLSGRLAHPGVVPNTAKYIGLLSQLSDATHQKEEKHLLILLSGPEPQRSLLSDILWGQLQGYKRNVIFIEGTGSTKKRQNIPSNICHHLQLTRNELLPLLEAASVVICRSGYSTLMDLVALEKKAIVIPTPGQTEQEYLARHLHKEGIFYAATQKGFDLPSSLSNSLAFPFKKLTLTDPFNRYVSVIEQWLDYL